MIDIRNFENQSQNVNYYSNKDTVGSFIADRNRLIKILHDNIALMEREYESLQNKMTPNSESAFKEKCLGWSKVLNGTEILYKMYVEKSSQKENNNQWS